MKKIALLLAVAIVMPVPMSVYAATPKMIGIMPNLSFDGTVAQCSLRVTGNSTSEHIEATIQLWQGNRCIATWYDSGNGYLFFSTTQKAVRGESHILTADISINGKMQPRVSCPKVCP